MDNNQTNLPPKWADDLLTSFCSPRYIDEIQGDLHEAFHQRCETHGRRRAQLLFVFEVFCSISIKTIDKTLFPSLKSKLMLSNHLKTGWRNFLKYKNYSLINLFGLSVGFCSALLLFLIVRYEQSFDTFHENSSHIYRLGNKFSNDNYDDRVVVPQAKLMDEEYNDIIEHTRFFTQEDIVNADDKFVRKTYTIVDPGFATMFHFDMIKGDLKTALSSAGQIVLTQKTAESLFGNTDPMGKTVSFVNEKKQFVVAGIAADPPSNSTLQFESLIPWASAPQWLDEDQVGNWYNTFMEAYVMVDTRTSKDALEQKLKAFTQAHFLPERKTAWSVLLLPMNDEHFRLSGNQSTIVILAVMAGAILLISCINFANLSIAQTLRRSREIGLRRVLGSLKRQVAFQFAAESAIAFVLALGVGVFLTFLIIPLVNDYYGYHLSISLTNATTLLMFLGCACLLSILSSTFGTAMALTKVKPVDAMKGVFKGVGRGELLRRSLLVVQFAASFILLTGTIVVWRQTEFMKSQDLKFTGNNVVVFDTWTELFRDPEKAKVRLSTIKDELQSESSVNLVALTSSAPGEYHENYNGFQVIDSSATEKVVSLRKVYMGEGYFDALGMTLSAGRDFSRELKSDTAAVILNETAMRELGWKDLKNRTLLEMGGGNKPVRVIGVVKDYFYQSLKRPIQPLIHIYSKEAAGTVAVQFKPGRVADGLKVLEEKWKQLDAFEPFSYRFVDKTFENLYKEQERLGAAATCFSSIAVVIACLGLLSITAYSIRLRRKEVGIRKVLGATVRSVVVDLSKQYSIMIAVGVVIACPIVYWLASTFLEDFAYRVPLSPAIFIVSAVAVFVPAIVIISILAGQAASENPVKALKEDG